MSDTGWVSDLDARQRAMLGEMGVRVWAPRPAAAAPQSTPLVADRTVPPPPAAPPTVGLCTHHPAA